MDRRSLMAGVVIGALFAGLCFAGLASAQNKEAGQPGVVGTYQVSATAVSQGNTAPFTNVVILDTRTGKCVVRRFPTGDPSYGDPKNMSFDMK